MKETFSIDEIKEAYWKTFHKSGEHFFDYLSPHDSENVWSTVSNFMDFLENLYPDSSWEELDSLVKRLV